MTIKRFTPLMRFWPCMALLCGLAFLSGCASDDGHETFPKTDYSYLPPLNLNVGQIAINNQVQPGYDDLTERSPDDPAQDLQLMAHQRLHTTGTSGTAQFIVTQAEMTKSHHSFSGTYGVKLTVDDPTHQRHGFITARVHRTIEASHSYSLERNLHTLNAALMDDMNVELEYQIRNHLASWLTDATGTPLSATTVQSQDLSSTELPALEGSTQQHAPLNNTVPSAPHPTSTTYESTTPTKLHSPPPGVLSLPQH
ncbi:MULTISPECIES: hypothetical protein [Bombella]|uniref:Lipoprotein n=1 Tax=Bombella pollinis TaxID=2967337 RepID=A0ABT3WR51_9PROT|nr:MULTISPECIES: hypothetical protein [Bombella]MCX5620324.1 hypothetical protein [Bombella pollinis]MUG05346.1 hypothetical protein [Bombella sp. ESL0378]MUG90893.1 hypothetical protein [Bombella sp. ESL0385]